MRLGGVYRHGLCECGYCIHPDHPARVELPRCCHDARIGALVTWGDECSLSGQTTLGSMP